MPSKTKNPTHTTWILYLRLVKKDGLWGGLAIAWKSKTPGHAKEFVKEMSSFIPVAIQNSFRVQPTITATKAKVSVFKQLTFSKLKIKLGRLLRR